MGLSATLSRIDGRPLGHRDDLVRIFERYFPGIGFGWTPSGAEKLAIARSHGVEYPPVLREHFEKAPAVFEGQESCIRPSGPSQTCDGAAQTSLAHPWSGVAVT